MPSRPAWDTLASLQRSPDRGVDPSVAEHLAGFPGSLQPGMDALADHELGDLRRLVGWGVSKICGDANRQEYLMRGYSVRGALEEGAFATNAQSSGHHSATDVRRSTTVVRPRIADASLPATTEELLVAGALLD
jgi:hypothetical protein